MGWVFLQPQHSDFVLDITGGVKTPGAAVQLWDMARTNHSVQFNLEPVEDEKDTYFIANRASGLYLEPSTDGNSIVQQLFTGAERQKWVFHATNPAQFMAPPTKGAYAIQAFAGKKF